MPTNIEKLTTRKSAIYTELAALDATTAGGLPNNSGPAAVDHVGYKDALYRELEAIDRLITSAEGAFEVTSEARG